MTVQCCWLANNPFSCKNKNVVVINCGYTTSDCHLKVSKFAETYGVQQYCLTCPKMLVSCCQTRVLLIPCNTSARANLLVWALSNNVLHMLKIIWKCETTKMHLYSLSLHFKIISCINNGTQQYSSAINILLREK